MKTEIKNMKDNLKKTILMDKVIKIILLKVIFLNKQALIITRMELNNMKVYF